LLALITPLTLLCALAATTTVAAASTPAYPPYPPIPTPLRPDVPCLDHSTDKPVPADEISIAEHLLEAFVGSHFESVGSCGNGLLQLALTPGSENLARRVQATFGSAVVIAIGLTNWDGRPGRAPRCGSLPPAAGPSAGYSSTLHLASNTIESDADLKGDVLFTNTSQHQVRIDTTSPIEVVLTKPGSRRVVGVFGGGIAGTAYGVSLSPGQKQKVSIVGGSARCDGGTGSALPQGRYDAVAEVSGPSIDGIGPPLPPTAFTQFQPIRIVAHR
jgi:hypothetical protein